MEVSNAKVVVVIDHDVEHAGELKGFLQQEGYKVKSAESPGIFFENHIDSKQILAVLFDHQGDAGETSQMLKDLRRQFGKETLMVFMHEFSVDAFKAAVTAGFNEYLAKPVGHDELLSLLSRKRKGENPKKISMTIKIEATIFDE